MCIQSMNGYNSQTTMNYRTLVFSSPETVILKRSTQINLGYRGHAIELL